MSNQTDVRRIIGIRMICQTKFEISKQGNNGDKSQNKPKHTAVATRILRGLKNDFGAGLRGGRGAIVLRKVATIGNIVDTLALPWDFNRFKFDNFVSFGLFSSGGICIFEIVGHSFKCSVIKISCKGFFQI